MQRVTRIAKLSITWACMITFALFLQAAPTKNSHSSRIQDLYYKLPLAFEVNRGQTDPQVKFMTRGAGYAFFLTPAEAVLSLSPKPAQTSGISLTSAATNHNSVLRISWPGANPTPRISGDRPLAGKVNYLVGSQPANWRTNVQTFSRVRYHEVYPGIDLVFYGAQRQLEYDFVLSPGADPQSIALQFDGAQGLQVARNGDLVLQLPSGEVRQHRPVVYQERDGRRTLLSSNYVIRARGRVGIEVADYDRSRTLVIDPTLSYSTFIGGSSTDSASSIAIDSEGRAYITGTTRSSDFPKKNARQSNRAIHDAFVTKFWATGGGLIYSTYLGGNELDMGTGIAVDSSANAYIVGRTNSTDFPTTSAALQRTSHGGQDAFVTKLSPSGASLVYSTYVGGTGEDDGRAMALDSSHQVYLTGRTKSNDFPLKNAFQSVSDDVYGQCFVTRLNASGSGLSYSTYLGGEDLDQCNGIAVDSSRQAYVGGLTVSLNFPTTPGAFQQSAFIPAGFVSKFSSAGSSLAYSTYLDGNDVDQVMAIAVDSSGRAYVTGETFSADFPVTANAFQRTNQGDDAFVTRLNASGSGLSYSTFLGGSQQERGTSIAVNSLGQAHVTGVTLSAEFPVKNALQSQYRGNGDVFVTKFFATGSGLHYSTFLGGSFGDVGFAVRLDGSGNAYIAGGTSSTDFPTTPGAFRRTSDGSSDAFVVKIRP